MITSSRMTMVPWWQAEIVIAFPRTNDHQQQDDDGTDDETALGHAVLVLSSDDQTNVTQGVLFSSAARTDCYSPLLLIWKFFFWCYHRILWHRFVPLSFCFHAT